MKAIDLVIGLEIHVELNTKSKIFCSCKNSFGSKPNTNVCPICLGLPGSLPLLNQEAVSKTIKAGLALGSTISKTIKFDRKHYIYPDLSKSYQITQNEIPLCIGGGIKLNNGKVIKFNHIHLEEDAGKLIHSNNNSFIDFNRAGVPLIECVTEACISSADEAVEFLSKLRQILIFAEVADCKMEQAGMRCDVNLSITKSGSNTLGTRVEIKNLNSFKAVFKAIEYEKERQLNEIKNGNTIIQETRRWNDAENKTESMREKQDSQDYRYMPNPDIPEIVISNEDVENIKASLKATPTQKFEQYVKHYNLPEYDASLLISEKYIADFFDECVKIYNQPKTISNWIITDLFKIIKDRTFKSLNEVILETDFCYIISLVDTKKISRPLAKQLLEKCIETKVSPQILANQENLFKMVSKHEIMAIINDILSKTPTLKQEFTQTPEKILNFIVGSVLNQTNGRADASLVKDIAIILLK